MSLELNAGALIDLTEAKNLVSNFSIEFPNLPKAFTVDASLLRSLMDQQGCERIRIYNGFNTEDQSITPVIIGVDDDNHDMLAGLIIDRVLKCPSYCGKGPKLTDQ
jgi:hypothetical protein